MRFFHLFTNNTPSPTLLSQKRLPSYLAVAAISAGLLTLSACGGGSDGNDNTVTQATYDITVYNLTNNQPLTTLGVVVHRSAYMPWQLGETVSPGLEMLAESGRTTDFLAEADANDAVIITSPGTGKFQPGSSDMVSITVDHSAGLQLTVASMLGNTNDAITGVRNWDIGGLAIGASASTMARVYDAGTEANSETAATLPGGGEGFNAVRDDLVDRLTVHSGVVTRDDGMTTSALDESHRWLGHAAKVVVTRTQ